MKTKEDVTVKVECSSSFPQEYKFKKGSGLERLKDAIQDGVCNNKFKVTIATEDGKKVEYEYELYEFTQGKLPRNWTEDFRKMWPPNPCTKDGKPRKWVPKYTDTSFAYLLSVLRRGEHLKLNGRMYYIEKYMRKMNSLTPLLKEGYLLKIGESDMDTRSYKLTEKGLAHITHTLKKKFRFLSEPLEAELLREAEEQLKEVRDGKGTVQAESND